MRASRNGNLYTGLPRLHLCLFTQPLTVSKQKPNIRNPHGFSDSIMENCAVGKSFKPKSQRRAPKRVLKPIPAPKGEKRDWFALLIPALTALGVALINKLL